MASRSLRPPGSDEGPRRRIWLHFQDRRDFELERGVTLVGRGEGCQLVLDDPLISRRHACFVVEDHAITIKDLGSTNGVLVNGIRVNDIEPLVPGDHITFGHHDAELCWVPFSAAQREQQLRRSSSRPAAATMVDQRPPGSASPGWESESTQESRVLDMLSGVAAKAFELGRGAEAERILTRPLEMLLERVALGRPIDAREADEAAMLAARLARATGRGPWIDYVFGLFAALERLPPAPVVDELHQAVRSARGVNLPEFRRYLEVLHGSQHTYGPAERFLLRRLEGLEGVLMG